MGKEALSPKIELPKVTIDFANLPEGELAQVMQNLHTELQEHMRRGFPVGSIALHENVINQLITAGIIPSEFLDDDRRKSGFTLSIQGTERTWRTEIVSTQAEDETPPPFTTLDRKRKKITY